MRLPPNVVTLWGSWWKALVGAAAVAPLVFLLGQCSGESNAKARLEASLAKAETKAVRRDGAAKAKADVERRADDKATSKLERELNDAVAPLPDAKPSARRVARGCVQLRDAGKDTSHLPQCR